MKKILTTLLIALTAAGSVSAMNYQEAVEQARYLTDKMAYELNLNDQQYNDCFEINLDYLLSIETADDAIGNYLAFRNADLRHILLDWQYTLFAAADYFFHPVYWRAGIWHFPIYRYYSPGYFYYSHPTVYWTYRGGHSRHFYQNSYYVTRRPQWRGGYRGQDHHPSVVHTGRVGGGHNGRSGGRPDKDRDGRSGGYPDGRHDNYSGNHSEGYQHPSSTRTTVHGSNSSSYGSGRSSTYGRSSSSVVGSGRSEGFSGRGASSNGSSRGAATRSGGSSSGSSHSGSHRGGR